MNDSRAEVRARLASPGEWGWYGSTEEHLRYVVELPRRPGGQRRCWHHHEDERPRASHAGMCNGVTLTSGCEWHVRQWARAGAALRGGEQK